MIKYICDKIKTAELVLVGLGEELDAVESIKDESLYRDITDNLKENWILPFVEKVMSEQKKEEKKNIYKMLLQCLDGKNYFIVSLCKDGFIKESDFNMERVVEPCGGYNKLQCINKCCNELYDVPAKMIFQTEQYINGQCADAEWKEPACPKCGNALIFNNVNAVNYVEDSYLDQWLLYKKWLQGTVNKSVCILEVGVGMKYPTVIRWPFEKMAFYNKKADFFRVHSKLYQIPKEMKESGHGICQKSEEFIKELSENF